MHIRPNSERILSHFYPISIPTNQCIFKPNSSNNEHVHLNTKHYISCIYKKKNKYINYTITDYLNVPCDQ